MQVKLATGVQDTQCDGVFLCSAGAQVRLTPRIHDGLTYSEGETMNVRVPVAGHPIPTVTWTKDGQELLTETGRREVWVEDGYAVLNVSRCRRTADRGVYGIRAENYLGVDQATFTVEITGNDFLFFVTKQYFDVELPSILWSDCVSRLEKKYAEYNNRFCKISRSV